MQRVIVHQLLYIPDLSQEELFSEFVCSILQSNVMKLRDFFLKAISEPLILKAIPIFSIKAYHGVLLSMVQA